ncbi:hypothetical protein GCM10010372_43900 [Streptomyces tauricus]|nr:hypothetical protein GCM10010372_43900 [Streptomyces tauricus]
MSAATVRLLLGPDSMALAVTCGSLPVHDPCCGAEGLFSAVEEFLRDVASAAELVAVGQELWDADATFRSRSSAAQVGA